VHAELCNSRTSIRPGRLPDVTEALFRIGITGITLSRAASEPFADATIAALA
jgi:hypothetical protein